MLLWQCLFTTNCNQFAGWVVNDCLVLIFTLSSVFVQGKVKIELKSIDALFLRMNDC